jgi:hypothetical protein
MSLLGPKSMLRGANPFAALQVKRAKRALEVPLCDFRWTTGGGIVQLELHKCSRVHDHRASHVCNCGKTTKRRRPR